jgi:hypothetical protein
MESNAMETPSGEVEEVEDTPAAFDEFADCDDEGLFDEQEDAACDKEHAAPEADDEAADAIDEGDAPNNNEPVSEIMLRVLEKTRLGTWYSCQRARFPLWAFFVLSMLP